MSGDAISPEEFRRYGHEIVDWVADYFEGGERYPVLSQVQPGEVAMRLPAVAPERGETVEAVLRDFEQFILPGITHWNQPGFFAYFPSSSSAVAVLAELLAAGLNANAMLWRTSPAATELEMVVLDWLRQMIGLPEQFEGVIYDTASTSSLTAIVAARQAAGLDIRRKGMSGRADVPRLRLYCSEQAHSSVERDAMTAGIGQEGVRAIPVDTEFRMLPDELQRAIEEDLREGSKPFCVVATVGTTSTASIDPVEPIAEIADLYGLWLHVDAAYAGVAAIVPEMRWVLDGAERADSLVLNPHKWLFTPVDLSVLYSSRLEDIRRAFSLVPEYLQSANRDEVRNYSDYGHQLGRRFRALKLWFVIRTFGVEGLAEKLREHIALAEELRNEIESTRGWEVMAPTIFSTICFRAVGDEMTDAELDDLNQRIMDRVNAGGEAFISHTRLQGQLTLRVSIGSVRTEERHMKRVWELLREARGDELKAARSRPGVTSGSRL